MAKLFSFVLPLDIYSLGLIAMEEDITTEITANMSRRSLMLKIPNRHTRLTRQVISPIMPATPGEQKLRNGCSLGKDISWLLPTEFVGHY
jgi:hypothetical protein